VLETLNMLRFEVLSLSDMISTHELNATAACDFDLHSAADQYQGDSRRDQGIVDFYSSLDSEHSGLQTAPRESLSTRDTDSEETPLTLVLPSAEQTSVISWAPMRWDDVQPEGLQQPSSEFMAEHLSDPLASHLQNSELQLPESHVSDREIFPLVTSPLSAVVPPPPVETSPADSCLNEVLTEGYEAAEAEKYEVLVLPNGRLRI